MEICTFRSLNVLRLYLIFFFFFFNYRPVTHFNGYTSYCVVATIVVSKVLLMLMVRV